MKRHTGQKIIRPPTTALAPEQVWAALSLDQQTTVYQTLIQVCHSLVSRPKSETPAASDER